MLSIVTRWGFGLCALLLILLALYVSLGRELTPLIAEYRAEVEQQAEQALGLPLSIGSLEGRWSGLAPILLAHDVMVGKGSSVLRLDQVRVVPALWDSLMARRVRLAHVELDGVQLSLAEDAQGHWQLKGLPSKDDQPFDPEQTLRQLQQVQHLTVLDSQLTLEPQNHAPLTFTYAQISLRNIAGRQRLDLRLTLPDGQLVAVSALARATPDKWRDASAHIYLSLPQSDWARWLPPSLTGQWHLNKVLAGGEAWLDWRQGMVQSAALRLNAPGVTAHYADKPAATLEDVAVNTWLQRHDDGLEITADSLAFTYAKRRWETRLTARQQLPGGDRPLTWNISADRLDLNPITPLLDALAPLPAGLASTLDHLQAKGSLHNLQLQVRPQTEGDQRVSFAANLDKVAFSAFHGAPAAANVSGAISGDLGHGELRLATQDFMLHLDPIFANPWYYKQANARLTWTLNKDAFTLVAPYIKVLGDEGKVAADFLIRLPFDPTVEPYMDLRVGMTEGDGSYTGKYLPAVLSPSLDHWLRTAIVAGKVDEGYFQYQGSLAHAAPDHSRNISLFFKVRDAQLNFQPGWPSLSAIDGRVYVDDSGVRVLADKGQMLDTQVHDVDVDVPRVTEGEHSHLLVDGQFTGSLGDGFKILQQAPIGTGPIFAGWEGEGPLIGHLKLDIPLVKGDQPKVVVDFNTENARLKLSNPVLELTQLKAAMRFDYDKGLSSPAVTAQAFGQPVAAQIFAEGKPGTPLTRITAKSKIALKSLTDWLQIKQTLPATGDIPYQLQVSLGSDARLSVDSDLKGLVVNLPAPYGKAADDTRNTTFSMGLSGPQRRVDVSYADLARLVWSAPATNLADGSGELLLGNATVQLPDSKGLRVRGELDQLDLGPWKQQVDQYAGGDPGGSARQIISGVDLKVGHLKGFGLDLDQVRVQLQRAASAWNLGITSQQMTGTVAVPDDKVAPIDINLQTLRLPPADPKAVTVENPPDNPDPLATVDPTKIPAVNVKIAQVTQGDDPVGTWSLKLRPTPKGLAFSDIDMGLKGLQLQGMGSWEGTPGASTSWFKGHLSGKNLGDVLKAWNFAPTVTSQTFDLDADGRWPGSPAWVSLKRYSGSFDASMEHGQLVEVDGGAQALRVFGLLNFNSIGRRLRLDFSDLLGKGLGYDQVKGLLVASNGVYVTREPITMTGPSSNFDLNGTVDMAGDRVDAKLRVTLPLTTNLPIAALLVGAPAIGGALFIVDKLLGDRVARLASVQYRVEGPIKEPKITFDKPFDKPADPTRQ
nr:YhdP family protein [Pseudomonas sp. dw_358]